MAPISPRLRRVLVIARKRRSAAGLYNFFAAEFTEWRCYKRRHNLPDDLDDSAGGWF